MPASTTGKPDRCAWASTPLLQEYHDQEWGRPVHDDVRLFEMLTLEGAQAGLSWETILRKREGYRRAFSGFDPRCVAAFGTDFTDALLRDPGIVRNRSKILSVVGNASAFFEIQREFGSFSSWLWSFVGGSPLINRWRSTQEIPAQSELSGRISKELKARGFRFVGPTIVYAFLQAVGLVNDHTTSCFLHPERGLPASR
jgi:DNA-3-methyladenine glycosylase I